MRSIVAFILVIFFSSAINKDKNAIDFGQRNFHYDSIPTTNLKIDSLELLSLIKSDNEVLGIYDEMTDSDKEGYLKRLLNKGTKFKLKQKGRCGKNRWYLISKETPKCDTCTMPFFKKPYKGLFLTLKNSKDKKIGTLKLAEYLNMQLITPWESRLTSRLTNDTTLISKEISTGCSDVDLSCWDTVTTTQWTITCDRIKLEKSEKIRKGAN